MYGHVDSKNVRVTKPIALFGYGSIYGCGQILPDDMPLYSCLLCSCPERTENVDFE